jgi:ribosomal-protein-alanine N-acetyltransferase
MNVLKGKNIDLVPFSKRHLNDPKYYSWLSDIDVVRYLGREEPIPFSEVREYVEQIWKSDYCSFFAVHHSESGDFIGTAKVNFFDERGRKNGVADIGIMIGERSYWGKGHAIDVLRTISIHSFKSLGARKLTAGAMSPNAAVVRAFERIGFVIEARLRQHLSTGNGVYCDHVLLGCFKEELKNT